MKRLTTRILFVAAALSAVVVSAPAQMVTAEIPFSFHAGPNLLAPGAYDIKLLAGSHAVSLRNADTGKTVMVLTAYDTQLPATWKKSRQARLRFDCAGARCVLRDVWPGFDSRGRTITGPKFARDETVMSREITLTKVSTK